MPYICLVSQVTQQLAHHYRVSPQHSDINTRWGDTMETNDDWLLGTSPPSGLLTFSHHIFIPFSPIFSFSFHSTLLIFRYCYAQKYFGEQGDNSEKCRMETFERKTLLITRKMFGLVWLGNLESGVGREVHCSELQASKIAHCLP